MGSMVDRLRLGVMRSTMCRTYVCISNKCHSVHDASMYECRYPRKPENKNNSHLSHTTTRPLASRAELPWDQSQRETIFLKEGIICPREGALVIAAMTTTMPSPVERISLPSKPQTCGVIFFCPPYCNACSSPYAMIAFHFCIQYVIVCSGPVS
jgi:hypothetical protein